ncbi:MAG: hypothetical protein ACE5PM_05050 [Candidatus Hydrothermarchaeales archaeon]
MRKKHYLVEKLRRMSRSDKGEPDLKRKSLGDKLDKRRERLYSRIPEKPQPKIMDFAIPESRIKEFFRVETSKRDGELVQTLSSIDDPRKKVKWTVIEDPLGWEFDDVRGEGLSKIKDYPPVYALETEGGALMISHLGRFTFTIGGSYVTSKELVRVFGIGLEHAMKFDVGISPLERELEEASKRVKELRREIEKKEARLVILASKASKIDELEEDMEEKERNIISKSSEIEKLKEKTAKLKSDIFYFKNVVDEYKSSVKEKDITIARQREKIEDLNRELDKIKTERRGILEEIDKLKRELEEKEKIMGSKSSRAE